MACMFGCEKEKKGECPLIQFYQKYRECEIFQQKVEEYRKEPVRFLEEVLQVELHSYQKAMLKQLFDDRYVK